MKVFSVEYIKNFLFTQRSKDTNEEEEDDDFVHFYISQFLLFINPNDDLIELKIFLHIFFLASVLRGLFLAMNTGCCAMHELFDFSRLHIHRGEAALKESSNMQISNHNLGGKISLFLIIYMYKVGLK